MSNPGDLTLDKRLERIESKIDVLLMDVTALKVKAGLVGGTFGLLISIVVNLFFQATN